MRAVALLEKGMIRYRDDLDLQNLIDYIQKKVWVSLNCGKVRSDYDLFLFTIELFKGDITQQSIYILGELFIP